MTAQVATVRQRMSVPAKFQIASSEASTATRMHRLVIQKQILLTRLGLRKPRRVWHCSELDVSLLRSVSLSHRQSTSNVLVDDI
jgi:hypothetical protein